MSATRTLGLVGRKAGMTRVFNDAGETVPVTVIEALPNRITQVRTVESDGYRALQVAFGDRKPSRLNKPQTGHYAKVKVAPGESLVEFRLDGEEGKDLQPGGELKVDLFTAGQVGVRPDGTIPEGFEMQHDQIWKNTLAILADAGMGPEDIVRLNVYSTDRIRTVQYKHRNLCLHCFFHQITECRDVRVEAHADVLNIKHDRIKIFELLRLRTPGLAVE